MLVWLVEGSFDSRVGISTVTYGLLELQFVLRVEVEHIGFMLERGLGRFVVEARFAQFAHCDWKLILKVCLASERHRRSKESVPSVLERRVVDGQRTEWRLVESRCLSSCRTRQKVVFFGF